jgi:uncharacterized phiE125 gp8 family phage protein
MYTISEDIRFEFVSDASGEVITLQEAKDHLRVDGSGEDAYISTLIDAAEAYCSRYTGRLLRQRDVVQYWDSWPPVEVVLYWGNVSDVQSVTVSDEDNIQQPFTEFVVDKIMDRARIVPNRGVSLPRVYAPANGLRISYTAGYEAGKVPADLIAAMKLLVADLYEKRESSVKQLPDTITWLLQLHRLWQI